MMEEKIETRHLLQARRAYALAATAWVMAWGALFLSIAALVIAIAS